MSRPPHAAITTAALGAAVLALTAAAPATAATAASRGPSDPAPRHLSRPAAAAPEAARGRSRLDVGRFRPAADGAVSAVVEFSAAPVAQRQARAGGRRLSAGERSSARGEVGGQQRGALGSIRATGATVQAQFADALNGVRVRVAANRLGDLARIPGVTAVRPVGTYHLDNAKGDALVTAPQSWGEVGATGKNVKIAIIDSGLDYYHADFGGSGNPQDFKNDDGKTIGTPAFPNAKVLGGYDFVGDSYNGGVPNPDYPVANNTPAPDPDPLPSCTKGNAFDHGTHVAGTAAGQGVLSSGAAYTGPYDGSTLSRDFSVAPGTAPEATLLAYRVFGCSGSTNVVVDAIDRAVKDGANVINMSLGSDYGTADTADAVATDNASLAGVTVVMSAGNPGQRPYLTGSPSTSTRGISVAASDAQASFPSATLSIGAGVQGINANNGPLPVTARVKVLRNPDNSLSLGCNSAEYAGTSGTIVITKRGTCARTDRATFGQGAGAVAVVLVNNSNSLPPYENTIDGVTIPFIGVNQTDQAAVVAADGTSITISAGPTIDNPGYKALAGFTAGGPRIGDSALKPDVTAPGVSTISARVGSGTGNLTLSGTSMASPTTAGVVADIIGKRPGLTPAEVKAALMSTADPAGVAGYNPRIAGAGLIQARRAVDTGAVALVGDGTSSVSFNYAPTNGGLSVSRALTLQNLSGGLITYDLASSFTGSARGAAIALSPATVSVPAGTSRQIDVTLTMSAASVAALPGAEPSSGNGSLTTVAGTLTATPRGASAPGVYPLHTPFLLVPRGLSAVTPGNATPYSFGTGTATTTVPVTNPGVHAGRDDVYAWQLHSPQANTAQQGDIRDVGVTQHPDTNASGSPTGDTVVEFLTNVYGRWSTPGQIVTDVAVYTTGGVDPDYIVEGVDGGLATANAADGSYLSITLKRQSDGTYKGVDAFNAEAPENSSTMGLPTLASDLGLTSTSAPFSYSVTTYDIQTGAQLDATTGRARYNPLAPPVSSGNSTVLQPGQSNSEPLSVNTVALAQQPTLGWLFVAFDDANGGAQADEVPLADTNGLTPTVPEVPATVLLLVPGLAAVAFVLRRGRRGDRVPA